MCHLQIRVHKYLKLLNAIHNLQSIYTKVNNMIRRSYTYCELCFTRNLTLPQKIDYAVAARIQFLYFS